MRALLSINLIDRIKMMWRAITIQSVSLKVAEYNYYLLPWAALCSRLWIYYLLYYYWVKHNYSSVCTGLDFGHWVFIWCIYICSYILGYQVSLLLVIFWHSRSHICLGKMDRCPTYDKLFNLACLSSTRFFHFTQSYSQVLVDFSQSACMIETCIVFERWRTGMMVEG